MGGLVEIPTMQLRAKDSVTHASGREDALLLVWGQKPACPKARAKYADPSRVNGWRAKVLLWHGSETVPSEWYLAKTGWRVYKPAIIWKGSEILPGQAVKNPAFPCRGIPVL